MPSPRSPGTSIIQGCSLLWIVYASCLLFIASTRAATIISPPELAGTFFDAPPPTWVSPNQTRVIGPLCRWEREEAPETIQRMNNCIAITSDYNVPNLIRRLISVGALGLILRDTLSVYPGTYDLPYLPTREFDNITVTQIGSTDTYKLWALLEQYKTTNTTIIVQIGGFPPDRNLWQEVRVSPVWYAVQALMSAFCFTALILALYKLVRFLRWRGFEGGVPQICLFFETLGNLFRVIFWAVDPIFLMRGIYTYAVSNVLLSIHVPMFVASTLCLSLHWHEILSQATVAVPLGLSKFKWSFVAIVVVLFILEFVSAGLRALDIELFALVVISAVIALIVTIATSAFFLITAYRVVKFLSRDAQDLTSAERRSPIVRKTVRIVIASAIFEILFALNTVLVAVPDLFYDPRAFHILLTLKDVFLSCISFTQIMAFKPPKGVRRGATGTGATVTTDSTTSKRGMRSNELSAVRSDTVTTVASSAASDNEESSEEEEEEESGTSQSGSSMSDVSNSNSKSSKNSKKNDDSDEELEEQNPRQASSSSTTSDMPSSSSSSSSAAVAAPSQQQKNKKKKTKRRKTMEAVTVFPNLSDDEGEQKSKPPPTARFVKNDEDELESEASNVSSDTGSSIGSDYEAKQQPKKSMRKTKKASAATAAAGSKKGKKRKTDDADADETQPKKGAARAAKTKKGKRDKGKSPADS